MPADPDAALRDDVRLLRQYLVLFGGGKGRDEQTCLAALGRIEAALAATASPGVIVETVASALYETDPPESWMATGTDEYRKRARAMLDIFQRDAALAADRETPPKDFGSQVAMKGGLPKDYAERIDRIEGR